MEHKCASGLLVRVSGENDKAAQECFGYYEKQRHLSFVCPFCAGELDNVGDETRDGRYEDTYSCDHCDVLVTLVTPAAHQEYYQTSLAEAIYEIDFMFGGAPSTWID